jgi:hypothetical protein
MSTEEPSQLECVDGAGRAGLWASVPGLKALFTGACVILVFFALWRQHVGPNVLSRLTTVERLVAAGTLAHEGSPFPATIDAVRIRGRTYSSKPPNYPYLCAGEALIVHALTRLDVYEHRQTYLWVFVLLNQVAPYMAAVYLLLRLCRMWTEDPRLVRLACLALTAGALPWAYAATYNNHVPAAAALAVSFYLTVRLRREPRRWPWWLAAGLLAGWAFSIEFVSGIPGAVLIWLLLRRDPRRGLLAVAGFLLPLVPTFATYWALTGSVEPFYMQKSLYDFEGSYWRQPAGPDALNEPKWLYAFNVLLGHHGLLSMTPLFLLALPAAVRLARDREHPLRSELLAILAGSAGVVLMVILSTRNYGGISIGVRWLACVMPLLTFASLAWLRRLRWAPLLYAMLIWGTAMVSDTLSRGLFARGAWELLLQGGGGPAGGG